MATSSKYLNSLLKILPAMQARQITELLTELQAKGEIRTAEEYEKKLIELSRLVNSSSPVPSFRQIRSIIWDLCSSDAFNYMMKAAQNDIESVFEQTNEIGDKINDHHSLVLQSLLGDLERGLQDQEVLIRELEYLADQNNEFSKALVNSFRSSSLLRVSRTEVGAESLYFDNRTYKNKATDELPDAIVSERGQKLILDTVNEPRTLPYSARILTDEYSYPTEINTGVQNKISNILDGTIGTYWAKAVYLSAPVEKVNTVIELDVGLGQDLNYIIIEGATTFPFVLESLVGISPDGHEINLFVGEQEISGKKRIDFTHSFLKAVRVKFAVSSYQRGEYFVDKMASLHLLSEEYGPDRETQINGLTPLIKEVLGTDQLADVLNVVEEKQERIDSYIYTLALDNIWFGNSLYSDQGIFVSSPLKTANIGVIAVDAIEKPESGIVQNSIEYEIVREDTTHNLDIYKFPIPKRGQTEVVSERLVLEKTSSNELVANIGTLRFCPYVDPGYASGGPSEYPIKVYKDGEALTIDNDFEVAIQKTEVNGDDDFNWQPNFNQATDFSNYLLEVPSMVIRILRPVSSSVYTVDYTLRTSDTGTDNTVWLNKEQTIYHSEKGIVLFKNENPDSVIESNIYLQITLRRNQASKVASPELYEYAVLVSEFKKEEA